LVNINHMAAEDFVERRLCTGIAVVEVIES